MKRVDTFADVISKRVRCFETTAAKTARIDHIRYWLIEVDGMVKAKYHVGAVSREDALCSVARIHRGEPVFLMQEVER